MCAHVCVVIRADMLADMPAATVVEVCACKIVDLFADMYVDISCACADMCRHVQACAGMCRHVQACANMFVDTCVGMCGHMCA